MDFGNFIIIIINNFDWFGGFLSRYFKRFIFKITCDPPPPPEQLMIHLLTEITNIVICKTLQVIIVM